MRTALTLLFLLLFAPAAHAASVAYIADGEVWLASLDGTQRVKLAGHVTNANGALEKWNAVAQADNGRIVASRNEPGKISSLSWFQAWEPDGTSTVQGPLNRTGSYALPVYPLSLDVTADGRFMVYGFSNSNCCPYVLETGTYVRPVSNSVLAPIRIGGQEDPTLFGSRVIAHSGSVVNAQKAEASTFGTDFTGWLQTNLSGLEIRRTDVAANGALSALELEQWTNGTRTTGKVAILSTQGVDQDPTGAIDCYLPATGIATDTSLSQDGTRVAWSDGDGLKVAGTPTTGADPCVLSAPAVTIAPTGGSASIGPANVAAFLPPPTGGGGGGGGGGGTSPTPAPTPPAGTGTPAAPTATVPAKVTRAALSKGLAIKVQAAAAGKVTLTATVPAKALGRKGKAVVVATGSGTANAAGTVTVKLKLNATGRKQLKRLKGKKATLRIAQGARSTTKTITFR